ncbi:MULTISPECIES: lysine biosynthesis protein LysW [Streptomyces]|uniref:lysine biosynthesis protein LysW n=1 Tax=Streptomyces TaxID=1883 RepID=UPI000B27B93E|nr:MULTISPECIES: lysine biosynthesis protein LysW [Streptomyces]WSI29442.1 lysine biosynthesis protein LysW [Streptomyces sp. NBC_01343]WSW02472.1 lysine biosynthesis protein LysW [Streptomyces sp. NBC_01006]
MLKEACPECTGDVSVAPEVELNEIVECAECMAELEIVSREPLIMALAPEAEEDWGE